MNDDNKYDAFKEVFRKKLENHQAPVDSSDWEAINRRLHGQSSSKKRLVAVWSAIAASLAILLTLAYLHNDRKPDQPLPKNPVVVENFPEYTEPTPAVSIPAKKMQTNKNSCKKDVKTENVNTVDSIQYRPIDAFQKEKELEKEKEPEKQPTEKQAGKPQNNMLFTADYPSHTKKRKRELLLAASFGTSQSIGINTTMQYMQNVVASDKSEYFSPGDNSLSNNGLIPDNLEGEYSPPLSFGLSIRKNLDTHWGIETGLVYTYLSSTYRWNYGAIAFDATQQLHYLGIPLNGVFYLWNNNPRWNAYLSAGTMLEKGLWMKTVRNQHIQNQTITTIQKSNIDGWQWSLNSSLGISYRFTNKMELYVEPRFSYYFDNNQPVSIRTDRPVSIGIGGGLRYSF